MKKLLAPCLAAALATTFSFAAPADDVKAATQKLADASSYAWTSTMKLSNPQFPTSPTEGVTEKGGYTVITRTFGGNTRLTVTKGEQVVLQNRDGDWVTREEMMQQFGGAGGAAASGRGARGGGMFGTTTPAEELSNLVAQAKDLKAADGTIVGALSEEFVHRRLSFGGRGGPGGEAPPPPKNASGSVTFWLKDGAIAKYELHLKGTVMGRDGEQERDVTTTVEVKDVGQAKATVPEEAKKKLGT